MCVMVPSSRIHGIFTPHVVPLDARGDINETALRHYVDWLIDKGVHGLYPNGSTGEFTRFSAEERRRITRIVCEQSAGRVPVLAGAAEANIRETIAACEASHQYGARAVGIVSPIYYRLSADGVFAYFREIARESPIDVTLYNIPMFASPIDLPTIRRLSEFDRIVGIKDSSGDLAGMMRMIEAVRPLRPDFVFMTGWDVVLVPMLLAGCQGGINATSGGPYTTSRWPVGSTLRIDSSTRCCASLIPPLPPAIFQMASGWRQACGASTSAQVGSHSRPNRWPNSPPPGSRLMGRSGTPSPT
jgi:dihydrodipicolinate synthase/N-acetylneuraminate lyase